MLSQRERLEQAARAQSTSAWAAFAARARPGSLAVGASAAAELAPAEGWVAAATPANPDPLGIARLRHDVAVVDAARKLTTFDVVVREQAALLRPHLAADASVLDQAERIETPHGTIRIVNKVCTVHARPLAPDERDLSVDEESTYETKKRVSAARARKMASRRARVIRRPALLSDADPLAGAKAAAPPLVSLRYLQRRWLALGYNKNKVGTALSVRYARPWCSTQMGFATMRFFCTGTTNSRHNRALIKYATLPYMTRPLSDPRFRLTARRFGAVKRVSQNIVASQRVPRGRTICLGLLNARLNTSEAAPKLFKSIVIVDKGRRATLLFYSRNIICVGTSSIADLAATYRQYSPKVAACYDTPENVAAERALILDGALSAELAEDVLDYVVDEATGELRRGAGAGADAAPGGQKKRARRRRRRDGRQRTEVAVPGNFPVAPTVAQ